MAGRTRHLAHEALEALTAGVALGLAVATLDVGADALEVGVVGALAAVAVGVPHVHLGRVALEDRLPALGGQVLPRGVQVEAELVTERAEQPGEVVADVRAGPGADHALAEGRLRVGDDQLGVDLHPGAEAVAGRAGAERRVERERARLEVVGLDVVVVGAGHPLGELHLLVGVLGGRSTRSKTTSPEARLRAVSTESVSRRLEDALAASRSTTTSMVCFFCFSSLGGSASWIVSPSTRARLKPWDCRLRNSSTYSPLRPRMDRRQHLEAGALLELRAPGRRSAGGSGARSARRRRAVRAAGARVEQPEVVVDLGDRADGRAGVLRGRLLVDRHRRAAGPR